MVGSYPCGLKTLFEKEEIARNEQFLLFPECFQKTCAADMLKKKGLLGERGK